MVKSKSNVATKGQARTEIFMSKFTDYSTTATYRRRRKSLDDRQNRSLTKGLSGVRYCELKELREIQGVAKKRTDIRNANALHIAMIEAKRRSGLSQSAIAKRLGMPQPNVSRIEHSKIVSFNTFTAYLMACGFDFTIKLHARNNLPCYKIQSIIA